MRINEEVFIRSDLNKTTTTKTTYFRLSKELRDFLQLLIDKDYNIEAIELDLNDYDDEDRKDNKRVGFNIGFVIAGGNDGE